MYIIKNISVHDVTIPELRITLSPNEKIDLDMVTSRFYIEQSRNLKAMLRCDKLKCIVKDDGSVTVKIPDMPQFIEDVDQTSPVNVMDAVKELEEKLAKRLEEKVANAQPQVDMNAFNQALAALQNLVGGIKSPVNSPQPQEKTDDVDNKKLVDIQKRTLNRLVNKAESNVKHEEQTTDKDVRRNVSELEGLL